MDFDGLKAINSEIMGWIKVDGTNIDYPIVQTNDNRKYLVRDYYGNYGTAGAIFIDYRNNGFNDNFSIIYGHRMAGDIMFGSILKFEDKKFFGSHDSGMLYTLDGAYKMHIIAMSVLSVGKTDVYDLENNRNGKNSQLAKKILENATHSRNVEISNEDKLIVLSTCNKDSRRYRDILLVKLEKI